MTFEIPWNRLGVPVMAIAVGGLASNILHLGPWGWLLGVALASSLLLRRRSASESIRAPALELEARLQLGGKTHLALVKVEGQRYLVAHGERAVAMEPIDLPHHTCDASGLSHLSDRRQVPTLLDGWKQ